MDRIAAILLGIIGVAMVAFGFLFVMLIQQFSAWGAGGTDYVLPLLLIVGGGGLVLAALVLPRHPAR